MRCQDSNPNSLNQNQMCSRYTTPQYPLPLPREGTRFSNSYTSLGRASAPFTSEVRVRAVPSLQSVMLGRPIKRHSVTRSVVLRHSADDGDFPFRSPGGNRTRTDRAVHQILNLTCLPNSTTRPFHKYTHLFFIRQKNNRHNAINNYLLSKNKFINR